MIKLVVAGWALAIAAYDLRRQRIPNAALLLGLIPAVLALLVNDRGLLQATPLSSVAGLVLALCLLLPGYGLGRMGAGDVKFAACLGLLLGLGRTADMLLIAGVCLGLGSVVWLKFFSGDRKARFPAGAAFAVAFCAELAAGPYLSMLEAWQ